MNEESNRKRASVGVLGLGIIGSIWARHLEDAGCLGGCWNRTAQPEQPHWRPSPEDVAGACRTLIIVVADPPAVESVLERIEPVLGENHLVIQSSTIDPAASRRFCERVERTGARYLEAPFTGSKPAAEAKKVVYYLGGPAVAIEAAEPVLSLLSAHRLRIGAHDQAAALKLAMNLQIAIQTEGLCEGYSFARSAGISDDVFFDALRRNVAWSGLAALKEPKLREMDFSPQFSIKHLHKDIRLALESAGPLSLPLTEKIRESLARIEAEGGGDDDFIALIRGAYRFP